MNKPVPCCFQQVLGRTSATLGTCSFSANSTPQQSAVQPAFHAWVKTGRSCTCSDETCSSFMVFRPLPAEVPSTRSVGVATDAAKGPEISEFPPWEMPCFQHPLGKASVWQRLSMLAGGSLSAFVACNPLEGLAALLLTTQADKKPGSEVQRHMSTLQAQVRSPEYSTLQFARLNLQKIPTSCKPSI